MVLLSLKIVLISTGVLSMAMGLKLTLPMLSDFVLSEAPSIWGFFLTWLQPPYLYILLNCIILTIVASSKFYNSDHSPPNPELFPTPPVTISGDISSEYAAYDSLNSAVLPSDQIPVPQAVKISGEVQTDFNVCNGVVSDGYVYDPNVPLKMTPSSETISNCSDEAVVTLNPTVRTNLQREDSSDFMFPDENEKPPISARFSHRKAVKGGPEGVKVALGVAKSKKQDTLESTWKTITEGRAMPLTRHLKKSDTWDQPPRRNTSPLADQNGNGEALNPKLVEKSETFSERSKRREMSASPGSGGRLRKEPSLSQDELNRRVEAFIKKFNEEMRLQRQESLRQYQEMVSSGAY